MNRVHIKERICQRVALLSLKLESSIYSFSITLDRSAFPKFPLDGLSTLFGPKLLSCTKLFLDDERKYFGRVKSRIVFFYPVYRDGEDDAVHFSFYKKLNGMREGGVSSMMHKKRMGGFHIK